MADKQEKAENMRLLHDKIIYSLTEIERKRFTHILNDFQNGRDRKQFVLSLRALLSTAGKQEVVPYLLAILPFRERENVLHLWLRTSNLNAFYAADSKSTKGSTNSGNSSRSKTYSNPHALPTVERNNNRVNSRNIATNVLPLQNRSKQKYVTFSPRSFKQGSPSTPQTSPYHQAKLKTRFVSLKRDAKAKDFGFSIRGGIEHGLGVFISSVDEGSVAEKMNLQCGDQIIKLNKHNFQNIHHSTAVQIIQQSRKLKMLVHSSGLVPGSRHAHMEYQWVDLKGRPSSPPSDIDTTGRKQDGRRSLGNMRLLQEENERRVILHVHNGTRLGLKIRGGLEYGLGIYVSSVDRNHVAQKSGIRAGDQILDINGIDFLEIRHRDAVRVLKSYKMMSMILRDVKKIPYSRTVLEETEWLDDKAMSRSSSVSSLSSAIANRVEESIQQKSMFRQGLAGSQLLHQSAVVAPSQRLLEEKARSVLTNSELITLKYYLSEYSREEIHVEGLVITLLHLLNTLEKMTLFNEIRSLVFPQDIDLYDRLVLEMEYTTVKENHLLSSPKEEPLNEPYLFPLEMNSPITNLETIQLNRREKPLKETDVELESFSSASSLTNIQAIISEDVVTRENVSIAQNMPVIEDLSFEEDEEESDYEVINIFNEEQLKEKPRRVDDEKELSKFRPIDDGEFFDIKESSVNSSFAQEKPLQSAGKHVQNVVNDQKDSNEDNRCSPLTDDGGEPDLGLALMRNALLGFSNTEYSYEDNSIEDLRTLEIKEPKEEKETTASKILPGVESHGKRVAFGDTPLNSREFNSGMAGENVSNEIPEKLFDFEDSVVVNNHKDVNVVAEINPMIMSDPQHQEHTFDQQDIIDVEPEVSPDANFTDDLEFEFEEEPEIVADQTGLFIPLRFAPIRLQETPTKFSFEEAAENKDAAEYKDPDKATPGICQENAFDNEPTLTGKRNQRYDVVNVIEEEPIEVNPLSDSNEWCSRYFTEENVLDKEQILGFADTENTQYDSEQPANQSSVVEPLPDHLSSQLNSQYLSPLESPLSDDQVSYTNKFSPSNELFPIDLSPTEPILQLPERNLTNKRYNITDYKMNNEKTENQPDIVHQETGLIRPLRKTSLKKVNHGQEIESEQDQFRSTFNNLRSIFEHQRPGGPRTEYLSEIIKKNNEIGRRRLNINGSGAEYDRNVLNNYNKNVKIVKDHNNEKENAANYHESLFNGYQPSIAESDLSSIDDFDFSSISPRTQVSVYNARSCDDKLENSSGYGSEECFNYKEVRFLTVRIEKDLPELGLVIEATRNPKQGVRIKQILSGENYAAIRSKELLEGQEIISVDGETLKGLSPLIASIALKRNYNNPSGRYLELVVKNQS